MLFIILIWSTTMMMIEHSDLSMVWVIPKPKLQRGRLCPVAWAWPAWAWPGMADVAEQKVTPGGGVVGEGVAEVNPIALIGNIW